MIPAILSGCGFTASAALAVGAFWRSLAVALRNKEGELIKRESA